MRRPSSPGASWRRGASGAGLCTITRRRVRRIVQVTGRGLATRVRPHCAQLTPAGPLFAGGAHGRGAGRCRGRTVGPGSRRPPRPAGRRSRSAGPHSTQVEARRRRCAARRAPRPRWATRPRGGVVPAAAGPPRRSRRPARRHAAQVEGGRAEAGGRRAPAAASAPPPRPGSARTSASVGEPGDHQALASGGVRAHPQRVPVAGGAPARTAAQTSPASRHVDHDPGDHLAVDLGGDETAYCGSP